MSGAGAGAAGAPVSACHPQATLLRFAVVSEALPLECAWGRPISLRFSRGRLIASNGTKAVWIDPDSGAHGLVAEVAGLHWLGAVDPTTGEIVVEHINSDWGVESYSRMNPETGAVTPVPLPAGEEVPCHLLFTGRDKEMVRTRGSKKRMERIGPSGEVLESIKMPPDGVNASMPSLASDGVILNNNTGVFFWRFGQGHAALMAGNASVAGESDGIGWRARFQALRAHAYSRGPYVFVRDRPDGAGPSASRLVRIDMRTDEVRTVRAEGFDVTSDLIAMAPVDGDLFVLVGTAGGAGCSRLLRAAALGESGSTLVRDWRSVDLAEELRCVTFHLANGGVLRFDRRVLVARSEYFRRMLSSGCKEAADGEVDLRDDPGVGRAALEDLLRFTATDAFDPVDTSPDHIFEVRALADRYQLPRLRALAEDRLSLGLSKSNVLFYLGRVFGSRGALERACWGLLEQQGRDIMQESEGSLLALIRENPELAKALMVWAKDFLPGGASSKRSRKSVAAA